MIVLEDKAQQDKKHLEKHRCMEELWIETIRVPLPVGDYVLMNEKIQDVMDRNMAERKPLVKR